MGSNVVQLILILTPIPPVFHAMFCIPNLALENAMACRVFRAVRLGKIDDSVVFHSTNQFRAATPDGYAIEADDVENARHSHLSIQIVKATECGGPTICV
jgi:hypothetical protein